MRPSLQGLALILSRTDVPQVLTHGLVAVGVIFLRVERSQILGYVSQILAAECHSLADSTEAGTLCALIGGDRSRACYGAQSAQVQTVAVGARGGCGAVRSQEHLLVGGVRRLLVDLLECTANGGDTRCPNYFCHKFSYDLFIYH